MLRTALLTVLLAGFATGAMAIDGPKYDRRIEAAVKKIVARKVGDIRGGFDFNAKPVAMSALAEEAKAEPDAAELPAEKPLVQVAFLNVPVQPMIFKPSAKYQSGRPEPIRKVRKITSFQYF